MTELEQKHQRDKQWCRERKIWFGPRLQGEAQDLQEEGTQDFEVHLMCRLKTVSE